MFNKSKTKTSPWKQQLGEQINFNYRFHSFQHFNGVSLDTAVSFPESSEHFAGLWLRFSNANRSKHVTECWNNKWENNINNRIRLLCTAVKEMPLTVTNYLYSFTAERCDIYFYRSSDNEVKTTDWLSRTATGVGTNYFIIDQALLFHRKIFHNQSFILIY